MLVGFPRYLICKDVCVTCISDQLVTRGYLLVGKEKTTLVINILDLHCNLHILTVVPHLNFLVRIKHTLPSLSYAFSNPRPDGYHFDA